MYADDENLRERVTSLESEVQSLRRSYPVAGVRKRSTKRFWGLPLYDIATGPDPERGEVRGHARGVIAIGDVATGVVAFGGVARGFLAFGGVAIGAISFGGCSIGILTAIGGFAVGGLALGGGAVGLIAVGGGALGYYAMGGGAAGEFVVSAVRRDPEAVQFFTQWFPGIENILWPRA